MATHSDSKLQALMREKDKLVLKQNTTHSELEVLGRDEAREVQKITARFEQKREQLKRAYEGLVRETEFAQRHIDKRMDELDRDVEKSSGTEGLKKNIKF